MYSQKLEPTVGKSQNRHFMSNIKFFTCYGKEILETMFDDEKLIIEIRMRSDQLEIRPMLVKLLQAFAKHQNYSLSTLHLGKKILLKDPELWKHNFWFSHFKAFTFLTYIWIITFCRTTSNIRSLSDSFVSCWLLNPKISTKLFHPLKACLKWLTWPMI